MNFKPFSKKQLEVLCWWAPNNKNRTKDAIICDGSVRSGKTLCMFISFIFWSMSNFSDNSFAVCGKTTGGVNRNIVAPMFPILNQLGFSVELKTTKGMFLVKKGNITNRYYIFGGKDESSAALIQGMTLTGVMFDEVALMPRSFVEQALARCSKDGSKFWFNCNPENPAHWFYKEWIKKSKDKNALYLHFTMRDNASLSEKLIHRYESLYSGAFYERFVKGLWVAAEGLVYPFFGEDNICEFTPDCDEFYISCDYGTVNPSSFGLWGKQGDVWYRIKEYYYNSKKEGTQKTDEEYYKALVRLAGNYKISAVICDPSAASFITLIRKKGEFRVISAKNDVIDGIRRVSDVLKNGRIKICKNCRDSIREFSLYRWDETASRDAVKKENDHAMDDIRYFVSTVLFKNQKGSVAVVARRQNY